jgi:hypothetical protein
MRQELVPVIIFALNSGDVELERKILGAAGIAFAPARGSYNGTEEDSWICLARDPDEIARILRIARAWSQESILYIDEQREADLYYLESGNLETLGKLEHVTELEARMRSNWTQCLITGQYFTVKFQ